MIDYDFEQILKEIEQPEQKKRDYDFEKILQESTQKDLDELRKKVENGLISTQDAQKEMTSIANVIPLDQLNFGASNFENGLIDSLVNIGASGEYIVNMIKKFFTGDLDKQFDFFKNLSNERKEQLAENPSFIRSFAKEIIPSMAIGSIFTELPALGSIGKNIASAIGSIPAIGKELMPFLSPIGKLSDLGLQSGLSGALSGFEGEKYKNAYYSAISGSLLSGAGSLGSKGLEKLFPTKSPKGMLEKLLKNTNISRKEFNDIFGKAENKFFELNSGLKQPLYQYDQTKENVFKMLNDKRLIDFEKKFNANTASPSYKPLYKDGTETTSLNLLSKPKSKLTQKELDSIFNETFNETINANTIDAVKNTIRRQASEKQFPKEFTDFFNKVLKGSVEPATRSNYLANQYYRNVNKMSQQELQILMALGMKDALQSNN